MKKLLVTCSGQHVIPMKAADKATDNFNAETAQYGDLEILSMCCTMNEETVERGGDRTKYYVYVITTWISYTEYTKDEEMIDNGT